MIRTAIDALVAAFSNREAHPPEATIVIEGQKLTLAQASSVRVAVSDCLMALNDPKERALLGAIADGYEARLREVEAMLVRACPGATAAPRRLIHRGGWQPMQPVVVAVQNGRPVVRFKANALVRRMTDETRDLLDRVAGWDDISIEDHEQFHQLLGYSVSGYGDLSFVRPETIEKADAMAEAALRCWPSDVATTASHPVQALEVDDDGLLRFKVNAIVRRLVLERHVDFDQVLKWDVPVEDRAQFYQLMGHSVAAAQLLLDRDTRKAD